jgi:preprotein translocase subunit SecG
MLLNILLVILVIDCIALTGVILLQRSEGGALGMGGGPSGMFTARGAGDLLTRTTSILTIVFFSLSLVITLLAGHNRSGSSLTEHMKVNPLDLQALTKAQKATQPAASSSPAAPPLPNAAPPLPGAAPPLPNTAAPPLPGAASQAPANQSPAAPAR